MEGRIKQINRNRDARTRFFLKLGFNHSQLTNYANGELSNRNSVYYAFGHRTKWKKNLGFRSLIFFCEKWGIIFIAFKGEGKRIIVYNTLGLDLLLEKQVEKWTFFGGIRATTALKREHRLASRRRTDIDDKRFRDIYTQLDDELRKIAPLSLPLGLSYEFSQDIFEVQLTMGVLPIHQATSLTSPYI